ncbi:MAG TPA: zinc ribbon domain-containing protein [Tepidisphaeraceae bacterium]|jgi:DNA-directed RNA polymerase subunit RPC12/RpoP
MIRRLFTVASVISLLLCIATVVIWVRSFASETILLESSRGRFLLIGIDCPSKAVREARDAATLDDFLAQITVPPPNLTIGATALPPPSPVEHRGLGFLLVRGEWCEIPIAGTTNFWTPPFWIVGVPYWFITFLTAAIPMAWLWVRFRTAQRRRSNRCPACGYDLRASSGRCPECGTPISSDAKKAPA